MEHHDFKPEEILWKDIIEIRLVNTDEGPSYPDIWLALIGRESCCHIPQEATGFTQVYDIVSKYEGFDFENVTKSMCSTSNEQFLLWRKAAA
ncbi:MAG: hypothetical protein LBK60_05050 [Verrucomicrobiales bacterium]|jgi:hypothetical protein|nr:hypothetical protein [Verrucomicrobiales bacterium]